MSSHTLTFSQLTGNFTVDKDLLGKQDPYVVFESGGARVQTKAIRGVGTGSATWQESYTLEEFSPSSTTELVVTVYNHNNLMPDGVIGTGVIDLSSYGESSLSGSGEPVTVPLVDKKNKETGTLTFAVNGGGYTGSNYSGGGSRGVTGAAAGAGAGAAGGKVVGVGAATDKATAQAASDKAAAEGRSVAVEDGQGVGIGHPVRRQETGTGTGSCGVTADTGAVSGKGIAAGGVTGGVSARGIDDASYGTQAGDVIDRHYYTGVETRPQDQALVEQYREHNPYQREYETQVQHTGRERLVGSNIEALGTRERVIGQDHNISAHPHQELARHLPEGAVLERPAGEGWVQGKPGPVCDTNTFAVTGDRTVDKERVTDLREHRDFEKEFEVKTRLVGEQPVSAATPTDVLNRERVLVDEKDKIACEAHPPASAQGTRHAAAGDSTGYGVGGTGTGSGSGYGATAGQKAASYVPGTEEHAEKKAAQNTY